MNGIHLVATRSFQELMLFVNYVIVNGSDAEFTNVNAGGTDVAARTVSGDVTLTDAELATVASLNNAGVLQASATSAEKASVASALLDALVSSVDLSTPAKRKAFRLKQGLDELLDILAQIAPDTTA